MILKLDGKSRDDSKGEKRSVHHHILTSILSQCWSRSLQRSLTWFRGCGYQGRQHRAEQKKVVVSSSRWLAVSRCGVHVLSILVSTVIIALNLNKDFIGIDFQGLIHSETLNNSAFLQIVAKVQELLIVVSLSTILFHLIRDELLYGEGISLGMLGTDLDFSKLSYFWSRELIGSLQGFFKGLRKYRKAQLITFLLLAGALSSLAGSSCAVLIVPQIQDWPIGSTPISLNGTMDSFWPVNLTVNSTQSAICSSPDGILHAVCPSGGYESLWSHYYQMDNSTYADHVPSYAFNLSGNHYYWSIGSRQPVRTQTISLDSSQPAVWMVQPHLSASIVLEQRMKDWWRTLLASGSYRDTQIIDRKAASSHVLNPIVRVDCALPNLLLQIIQSYFLWSILRAIHRVLIHKKSPALRFLITQQIIFSFLGFISMRILGLLQQKLSCNLHGVLITSHG